MPTTGSASSNCLPSSAPLMTISFSRSQRSMMWSVVALSRVAETHTLRTANRAHFHFRLATAVGHCQGDGATGPFDVASYRRARTEAIRDSGFKFNSVDDGLDLLEEDTLTLR